jgi:hypothetical protein
MRIPTAILGVVAFLLTITASSLASATTEVVRDPKAWDYAPLWYSDRIVRGPVVSTSYDRVSLSDLWNDSPEVRATRLPNDTIPVVRVAIRVDEVLRGPALPLGQEYAFLAWDMQGIFPIGLEMVVCLYQHPVLKAYHQASAYGRYVRKRKNWVSEDTPRGRRSFSDADMRGKIASMDLHHVATEAELVFEGDIDSVAWSDFVAPDSTSAALVTLDFRVRSVHKGAHAGEAIQVKALGEGMYLPEWRKHIPPSLEAGQRWICFLRKNEIGWYPFAGTNGWFRVSGDSLIYDERVRFWHSPQEVREAARRAQPPRE